MLKGLDRFEGRASLRTWTFSILVNRTKSRGARESKTLVDLAVADDADGHPTVDPDRFRGPGDQYPGGWTRTRWVRDPLNISPGNQRILLHRGRGALGGALEEYYRA